MEETPSRAPSFRARDFRFRCCSGPATCCVAYRRREWTLVGGALMPRSTLLLWLIAEGVGVHLGRCCRVVKRAVSTLSCVRAARKTNGGLMARTGTDMTLRQTMSRCNRAFSS